MKNKCETEKELREEVRLKINCKKKTRDLIVRNVKQNFSFGPFELDAIVTGDYNILKKTGYIEFNLKMIKPVNLETSACLVNTSFKFSAEKRILELLESLKLDLPEQIKQYFDISVITGFHFNPINKSWRIVFALQTEKFKIDIAGREFGITQVGCDMSGCKKSIKEKEVYIVFYLDGYPLKISHYFGDKDAPLLVANMERIPFGKMITGLTKSKCDDPVTATLTTLFEKLELTHNKFEFIDLHNFEISSTINDLTLRSSISNGKFNCLFQPAPNFKFENISSYLTFLDILYLNELKINFSNKDDETKGLTIAGFFPFLEHPIWKDLFKSLITFEGFNRIPFQVTIVDYLNFTASVNILNNLKIRDGLTANLYFAVCVYANKPPEFKIEGELNAIIDENDLKFRMGVILGVSNRLTASMIGTWENPLGLQNCAVKDLGIELGPNTFALMGEIRIGKLSAKLEGAFDLVSSSNMIEFNLENFDMPELLESFSIHVPNEISSILKTIRIHQIVIKSVPPGGVSICGKKFEEGLQAKLDCTIFDTHALFDLCYKKDSLVLKGEIDPIKIGNILQITSATDPNKGPSLDVELGFSLNSHFKIDGLVNVFNVFEQSVYAVADIQGIIFKTERKFKLCGLDFISADFELRVGLMRFLEDGFIIRASFHCYEEALEKFGEEIRKFAYAAKEAFENAQFELMKCQDNLNKEQEVQRNKHQEAQQEWDREFNRLKFEADLDRDRKINQFNLDLNHATETAERDLKKAQEDAWKNLEWEKNRAKEELEREKNRAHNELTQRKTELENTIQNARNEVYKLDDSIRWHENLWWTDPRRIALAGLYSAKGLALGGIEIANETAKSSLNAADGLYMSIIDASNEIYKGMLITAESTCYASIEVAKGTKTVAIEIARFSFNTTMCAIAESHKAALEVAREAGNKARDTYYGVVDVAFEVAKGSVNVANSVCEGFKVAGEHAGNFLADTANTMAQWFVIKLISFEFDLKKRMAEAKIQLLVMGKYHELNLTITFDDVGNFFKTVSNELWKMVTEG